MLQMSLFNILLANTLIVPMYLSFIYIFVHSNVIFNDSSVIDKLIIKN